MDTEEVWSSITVKNGSVQHLEFLSEIEKAIYKTAFEIDQRYLVELAGDRTKYVCQAQSLNIFLKPDVHKRDLHNIHFLAWKKGLKSLYYLRSMSLQRAEVVTQENIKVPINGKINQNEKPQDKVIDYEECLSCQ